MAEATLTCPRCHAEMAHLQRGDAPIERCASCSGVFLDEAELTRLVGAVLADDDRPAASTYRGRHRRDRA